jgi:biotin carboxyl carrier protein
MRNTIRAPRDGIVLEVRVDAGRHVDAGDPLAIIGDPAG